MRWLDDIANKLGADHPQGEIVVSSGVSPSGAYHLGTLREVMTAEIVAREMRLRGRDAKHIHVSDDLDIFRKVPVDVPSEFEKYLGMPLCDMPSPDLKFDGSYADYFVSDLEPTAKYLYFDMEIVRAHEKYRSGHFTEAIEKALSGVGAIRKAIEDISGRKLEPEWSPVQVIEDGRLKNRKFISIDAAKKTISYEGLDGKPVDIAYDKGKVKLNWRIDWPARWWLLNVNVEPFGKDHATKGGSYDTGVAIVRDVYGAEPPLPIPYNFINKAGETKKMSKSAGDAVTATDLIKILPAEVLWYFMLRSSPDKLLVFDTAETLIRLFDEFSELLSKAEKSKDEQHLIDLCLYGIDEPTVSRVPFTLLYASYQASLRNVDTTLQIIARTEYVGVVKEDEEVIRRELSYIASWLDTWAPEEVKFELRKSDPKPDEFTQTEVKFLRGLAGKVSEAPENADGEWFHKAIYEFKEELGLQPKELFSTLYRLLINKNSGPRAGWFLSILPRDWLAKRLRPSKSMIISG
jgi:lysyl-tRNA synthetase, class I